NEYEQVDEHQDVDGADPDGVDVQIGDIDNSEIIDTILESIQNAGSEEELAGLLSKLFEKMGNVPDASGPLDPEIQAFLDGLNAEIADIFLKCKLTVNATLK